MLITLVPRLNRPRLLGRVAPYVVDVSPGARDLLDWRARDPLPVLTATVGPAVATITALLAGIRGADDQLAARLRQAGDATETRRFRARQLMWALLGVGGGGALAVTWSLFAPAPLALQLLIVVVSGAIAFLAPEWLLQFRARGRLRRMTEELPTLLEFLTLSLSAGEGIFDAVRRVSRLSSGELASELRGVVGDVAAGIPFATSLTTLGRDLRLDPLSRLIDQLTAALDRGSPLVDVLRAQAQDCRDHAKRELIESAGRKEIAMLLPLVFLILPTTIVIAIYPGIAVLRLAV
ncbi:pilus assembly protein [Galbitalea soli]|uniref:Pilus assembly protein n=2 Tax=Galbitalea soli TaxID=1268042 RepID=A0A7C9TPY0_9MICO|nr:type II secretion system F family protein [Galbitalea soli]NEM90541.1 pilus assembly protein [Galbitalea soli]